MVAAIFTGGLFILATFHFWWSAAVSGVIALAFILYWLWSSTAVIPEKEEKDVGLGLKLPLYMSGSKSVGWWAMFITMLGDMTAFVSLVFGYFFYWTLRPDFLAGAATGPGVFWPAVAGVLLLGGWAVTVLARKWNREDRGTLFHGSLLGGVVLALAGSLALIAGPWLTGLDPTAHVYPATVWVLVLWTVVHIGVGIVMQLYCVARRMAGRMTARYDIDIHNVALYWHFMALTAAITVGVIAGFPLVA